MKQQTNIGGNMKLKLEINMDNAAFDNIPEIVLADMLEKVGQRIERGGTFGAIIDANGNKVGTFDIEA